MSVRVDDRLAILKLRREANEAWDGKRRTRPALTVGARCICGKSGFSSPLQ